MGTVVSVYGVQQLFPIRKSARNSLTPTLHFRYFERALKNELSAVYEGKI